MEEPLQHHRYSIHIPRNYPEDRDRWMTDTQAIPDGTHRAWLVVDSWCDREHIGIRCLPLDPHVLDRWSGVIYDNSFEGSVTLDDVGILS